MTTLISVSEDVMPTLTFLDYKDILHDQILQIRPVEHIQRIGRRTDHGFAAAVEGGVERDAITGQLFQLQHQVVPARVVFALEHLGAGGAIFVDDFADTLLPAFIDLEGESHEGTGMVDLEHLRRDGIEHRRAEGSPALAELDLLVDAVGHARHAGAANNGAAAEGARAELHTPLEPGDRVAIDHDFGDALGDVVDLLPHRLVGVAGAGSNDVLVAVGRAEVDVLHLFHRHAALVGDVGGGTHRGTGVAGSGLNEQLLHLGPGDDFLVELDVQRAAAG